MLHPSPSITSHPKKLILQRQIHIPTSPKLRMAPLGFRPGSDRRHPIDCTRCALLFSIDRLCPLRPTLTPGLPPPHPPTDSEIQRVGAAVIFYVTFSEIPRDVHMTLESLAFGHNKLDEGFTL